MSTTLLIRTLNSVGFGFECAAIRLDVFQFLAIVVDLVIPRLTTAPLICRRSGKTSSLIARSVRWTLYYIGFVCRVFCKRLSTSCFIRIAFVTSEYFTAVVEALHTIVTKVSHEEGRLLMSSIALSSSSIVVPWAEIWELRHFVFVQVCLDRIGFFHPQIIEAQDRIYLCRNDFLLISVRECLP